MQTQECWNKYETRKIILLYIYKIIKEHYLLISYLSIIKNDILITPINQILQQNADT
jgi:hypothetical protein